MSELLSTALFLFHLFFFNRRIRPQKDGEHDVRPRNPEGAPALSGIDRGRSLSDPRVGGVSERFRRIPVGW